jgi:hypothetical protein
VAVNIRKSPSRRVTLCRQRTPSADHSHWYAELAINQVARSVAVAFKTSDPSGLLARIKHAVDNGAVDTWSYDKDGDFTHTPTQWKSKAWLRPSVQAGQLRTTTIKPKDANITWEVYAIYMGRFSEMMIAHFHDYFSLAESTAKPTTGDHV